MSNDSHDERGRFASQAGNPRAVDHAKSLKETAWNASFEAEHSRGDVGLGKRAAIAHDNAAAAMHKIGDAKAVEYHDQKQAEHLKKVASTERREAKKNAKGGF